MLVVLVPLKTLANIGTDAPSIFAVLVTARLAGVIVNSLVAGVTVANVRSDATALDARMFAFSLTLGFRSLDELVILRTGADVRLHALSTLAGWMTSWNAGVTVVDHLQLALIQRVPSDFPDVLVVWMTAADVWSCAEAVNARWIADWLAKGGVTLDSLVTVATVTDVRQDTLGILTGDVARWHADVVESVQTVVLFCEVVAEQ